MKKDYLHVIWKSPKSHKRYIIGNLEKTESEYVFSYSSEVKRALNDGYVLFQTFPSVNGNYISKEMFPIFLSRLPDKKRKDINKILNEYGLCKFDAYELLKKTKGKLPIDNYEFIVPIEGKNKFDVVFPVAGVGYSQQCKGQDCSKSVFVEKGEELQLKPEPDCKYDSDAVRIYTGMNEFLGYVPHYYSKTVNSLLTENISLKCTVNEVDKNINNCVDCIKVNLILR